MVFYSRQTAVVLLLHRVLPVRDTMWDPMDPALFEQVLKYVQQHFHTLPLHKLLFDKLVHSAKPLAAITFDEGDRDFIDFSIPLLKQNSITEGTTYYSHQWKNTAKKRLLKNFGKLAKVLSSSSYQQAKKSVTTVQL